MKDEKGRKMGRLMPSLSMPLTSVELHTYSYFKLRLSVVDMLNDF